MKAKKQKNKLELTLYITGSTPRSARALSSVRSVCDSALPGQYELKVVDIYQQPAGAIPKDLVALPMLEKRKPAPRKRYIGGELNTAETLAPALHLDSGTL